MTAAGVTDLPPVQRLRPYVGGLAAQWLQNGTDTRHRRIHGSLAFVDISGFTALTERLAAKGKVGAEEMSDLLSATFATLLEEAYSYGASLVKWGGDAVLLLFEGDDHALLACRAAHGMRATMRRVGRLRTSVGVVQLRMSVGIDSGAFDFFLVGSRHHELLVAGPAATATAVMEQTAEAGEIVVSAATAALLPTTCVGAPKEDGFLLRAAPKVWPRSRYWTRGENHVDVGSCLDPAIRDHLLTEVGESEHRQVGVGFVEISGVDALLERQGPGAVASALHEVIVIVQEECAHHEVTFWETDISKDGFKIMLISGAPRSSGRDEEGLLRAARRILDRHDGPIRVRIGVNAGRVFNGGFGPPFRRTWSVKGDAINLAARVMGKSGNGELWATEGALAHCRGMFDAEAIEPFMVKGKTQPVHAHRIRAIVDTAGVDEVADAEDLPLVGRDRELATLGQAAARAREGAGSVIELVGEPGIGKSRLVAELRSRCPDLKQVTVVCDAYQSSTPYAPVRSLLRDLLEVSRGADAATVGAALTAVARARAHELLDWLPLIAVVAGAEVPATRAASAVDEQFRRARIEQATVELVRALLTTPTLLVVDDAHLADDASAALLAGLCDQAQQLPWVVVVTRRTARTGFAPTEPSARIDLVPLDAVAAQAIVATLSDESPLRPHEIAVLTNRAEGNPLFLLQLLDAVRRSGSVDDLPDSVEGVITTRIDRLPPLDRRVLRTAAVLGTRFDGRVLERMLVTEGGAERVSALDDFLERQGDVVAFRHALVRDTAYEGLPYSRRRDLHARAGGAVEELYAGATDERADLLSLHFFEAGDPHRAWRYSLAAGERAVSASAYVAAATFYERAVVAARALRPSAEELARLHESLGDARLRIGEFDRAQAAYARARAGFRRTPLDLARTQFRAAQAADLAARYPLALRWLSVARRTLDAVGDPVAATALRAEIDGFYGLIRHRQGRDADAAAWCRRAIVEADTAQALRPLAAALMNLDLSETVLGLGDGGNAARALELWQELGDLWQEARTHNTLGMRAYYVGRWDDAARSYDLARDAALRAGDEWMATIATANVAEILSDQGRLAEAEPHMQAALRTLRATGARGALSFGQSLMGRLLARQGKFSEALAMYLAARRLQSEDGEQALLLETDARIAECLVWAGRADQALERAQATLATVAAFDGAAALLPLLHRVCAMALLSLGRRDEAVQATQDSLAGALGRDARHELAWTLDVLLAVDPAADDDVVAQRDALAQRLGMVAFPPASAGPVESAELQLPEESAAALVS